MNKSGNQVPNPIRGKSRPIPRQKQKAPLPLQAPERKLIDVRSLPNTQTLADRLQHKPDRRNQKSGWWILMIPILVLALGAFWLKGRGKGGPGSETVVQGDKEKPSPRKNRLTKDQLAQALAPNAGFYQFPQTLEVPLDVTEGKAPEMALGHLHYGFSKGLQQEMQKLFDSYRPDRGAFVALDATTGQVLSMVSYTRDGPHEENLALKGTFPSASVFKVVTAAAALSENKLQPETLIPYSGRDHTLYKKTVLKAGMYGGSRQASLKQAFARSINTVFGKIGAFQVGPEKMRAYADKFGFNRKIASDVPMQMGHAPIPNDAWSLAETASGYTRDNTMSPLHGAMIAATIVNRGVMMEPFLVSRVSSSTGEIYYEAEPKSLGASLDAESASEMRELMRETVTKGTSRRSFRGFFKGDLTHLDVGGKTGSLTGENPPGKYDWFVGYADNGTQKIAVAALTINHKYWTVKSSYLARRAFEFLYKGKKFGKMARQSDGSSSGFKNALIATGCGESCAQ
jgi:peptidoglycan glycosyltransferase